MSDNQWILCEVPCSDFVTKPTIQEVTSSGGFITSPAPSLPPGLQIVRGLVSAKFSARVLARLSEAEQKTPIAIDQQDYRIAWLTVLRADEGNLDPWRQAFWEIVGNLPEKTIPFWQARADLLADEYVPLALIDLKYTKDWGGQYIRAKMAADEARAAELPPKKPPYSIPSLKNSRKHLPRGFTKVWSATLFASICAALIIGAAIYGQSKEFVYSDPSGVFQILKRYDAYHYKFNQIGVGELAVTFCPNYEPQLSAGQTIWWLRYIDKGKCWDIQPNGFGYRLVRDASGKPTLPPTCFINAQDITQCKPNPLEARF